MDSTNKMPDKESIKKASVKKSRQRANRKERETEQEADIRRQSIADKKAERRRMETLKQALGNKKMPKKWRKGEAWKLHMKQALGDKRKLKEWRKGER
jgi:hypothetical protein